MSANKLIIESVVIDAISLLKAKDNYSITALAKSLSVSRAYIYKNYKHLIKVKHNSTTEEKIKLAILILKEKTNKKKLTISDVAKEAGLSRQLLSQNYKNLHPFIRGELNFETTPDSSKMILEKNILSLKDEIVKLREKSESNSKVNLENTYTTLMIRDLDVFSSQKNSVALNKIQNQNDELRTQCVKQLNELSNLKSELSDFKFSSSQAGPITKAHFKADFSSIHGEFSDKNTLKLFLLAEVRNLEAAIQTCITSNIKELVFFQPFLSCNINMVPIKINCKELVILESNLFLPKYYKKLTTMLPNCNIHAVSAKNLNLTNTRNYCRVNFAPDLFKDGLIKSLLDNICYPCFDDDFFSISIFNLPPKISIVR